MRSLLLQPYQAGTRLSRRTGQTICVLEFKPGGESAASFSEYLMDAIEAFISDFLVKSLHKSIPAMAAADDAKVTKAVTDFVTTAMDLAAVYFALRNARATPAK